MTPPIPIQVYGINLLVRLMGEGPADVRVHCPKGSPIRYGEVIARGDGFDEGANAFREMPGLIRAYNESTGVPNTDTGGYHETITLASLRAACAWLARRP